MPNVINYDCVHYRTWFFDDNHLLTELFYKDLSVSQIDINWSTDKFLFVVDFMHEGADASLAKKLLNIIENHCKNCITLAFVNAVSNIKYQNIIEVPWFMAAHCGIHSTLDLPFSNAVDKKFLCLIRRASWSRARFAYSLIKAVPENLRISFDIRNKHSHMYQDFFADVRLPLLIDGVEQDVNNQHRQTDKIFWNCLFNIVVETSSQHDENVWHTNFITEKTFKAFFRRQIPIWFAVPGLVQEVRKLGFDLFDDLINHNYDNIKDEYFRIQAIIAEIVKLDATYTTTQCEDLRNELRSRLEKNFQLAKHYASLTNDYKYTVVNKHRE